MIHTTVTERLQKMSLDSDTSSQFQSYFENDSIFSGSASYKGPIGRASERNARYKDWVSSSNESIVGFSKDSRHIVISRSPTPPPIVLVPPLDIAAKSAGFIGVIKMIRRRALTSLGGRSKKSVTALRVSSVQVEEGSVLNARQGKNVQIRSHGDRFQPSTVLADLIKVSRQEMKGERDFIINLWNAGGVADLTETSSCPVFDPSENTADGVAWIEEEIRLFVETIGRVTLSKSPLPYFVLTQGQGTKFLPSIESSLLLPFNLTTSVQVRFLEVLLGDLKAAATHPGMIETMHGRLDVLGQELIVRRRATEDRRTV